MKKILSFLLVVVIIFGLCSCSSKIPVTAEDVYYAIEAAGFPVHSPTVVTEETDSNELLGRPGQYTSKVVFYDIAGNAGRNNDKCTIEVFDSSKDAKTRFDYVKSLSESISMLSEYDYLNDIVILRIDNCVSPADAQKYEEWFTAQDFSDFSFVANNKEETESSEKVKQTFTEPTGDTIELVMPKYLMDDEEFNSWVEKANSYELNSEQATVRIDGELVIVTVTKDFYDKNLSMSSFTNRAMEELSAYSSFKSIVFSDDFLTANITVDKAKYSSKDQYNIIKLANQYITERSAYFKNFEPAITINLFEEGSTSPFYSFHFKRPAEKIHKLSVDEITNDFSKDESIARKEYISKYVEITGKIQTVEISGSEPYILIESIENPDNPIWVQGNINLNYNKNFSSFQRGNEITIIGKCVGYDYFVLVDDCVMF